MFKALSHDFERFIVQMVALKGKGLKLSASTAPSVQQGVSSLLCTVLLNK